MRTVFIKARPGCRLWDPETHKFLPESGAKVKRTQYWGRRITDGDAIETPIKAKGETPAPAPAPTPAPEPTPPPPPSPPAGPEPTPQKKKKGKK